MSIQFYRNLVHRLMMFLLLLFPSDDAWAITTLVLQNSSSDPAKMLAIELFAHSVNEKTNGQVVIDIKPPFGKLSDRRTLGLVKFGEVDMALVSEALSSEVIDLRVFELPYLVTSHKHMAEIVRTVLMPKGGSRSLGKGILLLGVLGGDFRDIISRKPLRFAGDFAGLELSIPALVARGDSFQDYNNPTFELFAKLGAKPISIPANEAPGAAHDFYVDAVDSTLPEILDTSYTSSYQNLHYLTLTRHAYDPFYLVMNENRFRALDRDVQETLQAAARDAADFAFQTSEENDSRAQSALQERGIEVIEWPPSQRRTLEDISRPLYDRFSFDVGGGQDLVSQVLRLSPRF